MAPVKSVTLRPRKNLPVQEPISNNVIEDDTLSIRSIDSRNSRDEPISPILSPRSFRSLPRAITPPPKVEGIEEGMRCEVANQLRDRRGLFGYRTEVAREASQTKENVDEDKKDKEEEPNYILHPNEEWIKQFAVVARKRFNPSAKDRSELDALRIRSPLLKSILRELCKDYPGFGGHKGKSLFAMDMYDPFDGLFHCWNELLRLEQEHSNPEARDHIKLLHDLMQPHFKTPLKKLEECRTNGNITFNSLWTIFKPGDLLYRKDIHGRDCVEIVDDMYYGSNNDRTAFKVESKMICWDGKQFGYGQACGWFYDFSGTMSVMDLPAMPLDIHPDRVAIKARMMKRGEKFQQLAGCHLKAFTGPPGEAAYRPSRNNKASSETLQVYDRIIINPDGVGCPRTATDLEPLTKDNPFDNLPSDTSDRIPSSGSLRRAAATDLRKAREEWGSKTTLPAPKTRGQIMGVPSLTEEQMLICNLEVAAFDLTRKEWTLVDVNEIGDVAWNEDLFDDLIWPAEEKELLLSIAQSYFSGGAGTFGEILDRKSHGSTIMLSGPSGCGKAFAVEAVAEKLHMPLYTLSVGELVRDFKDFEQRLEDALTRAAKWNAILLIKNLDFFFDKTLDGTTWGDVVGWLMHHLERHPGLVVLTSSSLDNVDPLLKARFDLTLAIPEPGKELRRQMWANALSAAVPLRERHFSSEHLDELAKWKGTGRGIGSVVKMAGMVASGQGRGLRMEDVERVLKVKKAAAKAKGKDKEEGKEKDQEKKKEKEKEKEKEPEVKKRAGSRSFDFDQWGTSVEESRGVI